MHVDRTVFLWRDAAFQRFGLRNHGARAVNLTLTIAFDSDFADVFEVRGMHRPRRGYAARKPSAPDEVALSYTGLDRVVRTTALRFDPTPAGLEETEAYVSDRTEARRGHRALRDHPLQPARTTRRSRHCAACRVPGANCARARGRRRRGADVEPAVQRRAVPVDGRHVHADHGDA